MLEEDFDALLNILLEKVLIVPVGSLLRNRKAALDLVKDIDLDNAVFVACALAFPGSAIWSDDKHLKKVDWVKVLNTKEMSDIL